MGKQIGITTTVPVEILLAAGHTPIDLNNRFVNDSDPAALVREAEELGLARTLCAWIKGIYAWALAHPEIDTIIAITQGDCSNTHALMELLSLASRKVIPFDFPFGRAADDLEIQLKRLAQALGANLDAAEEMRRHLIPLRKDLARLDELTWREGKVTGGENHLWLVSASDFDGDPDDFHQRLRGFMAKAEERPARGQVKTRLGVLGVPTIMDDLHERLEELGAAVVFNEVPRQFAMLPIDDGSKSSLVDQYRRYTYPYDVFHRIEDIKREVRLRNIDGLVHYTQSFCFRQIQDMVLREKLKLPMLTLEGDRVGPVDPRTKLRLEAFIDVLR
jgi:benzoyl-CoA reductase/2-hydroxyglutaryl-CoA dehydratase subunit BcrC/BadD/HgdB